MQNKYLVSIVGPTAIGKTALGISIAQYFKTEIISSDSRQFYKEMCIGTAVPNEDELAQVKHHFIQHLSIHDSYSVGQFEKDANALLNNLFEQRDVVVLVGGSGLFHKAITQGLDDFPDIDPKIRKELITVLETKGIKDLQEQLKEIDPMSFESIDIQNHQRLIRALEVTLGTGIPFSKFKTNSKKQRYYKVINIGLTADRALIYERINKRVDAMMDHGLLVEAEKLYKYRALNALNTVGYKELFDYLDKQSDLPEAIEKIKTNTRRFAKRQLTWFRKDNSINWFDYDTPLKSITEHIDQEMSK